MKKTLLSLGLMLTLSFVMLIGTTYAWFSETITVSDNTIRTGTFDIDWQIADPRPFIENQQLSFDELEWFNLDTENGKIFDNDYLYTGFQDVRVVKVTNTGEIDAAIRFKVENGTSTNDALKEAVYFAASYVIENEGVYLDEEMFLEYTNYQDFETNEFLVLAPGETATFAVAYFIDPELGNDGQEQFLQFDVTLEAIQVLEAESRGAQLHFLHETEIPQL